MKRVIRTVFTLLFLLGLCGCQGTKSEGSADHRQDQASRQTARDAADRDQAREPMDAHSPSGQGVIDQPR